MEKEDRENNSDLVTEEVVEDGNPFLHSAEKMQALESKDSEKLKTDSRFSVAMLDIDEGE